jgi:hypothetical protein
VALVWAVSRQVGSSVYSQVQAEYVYGWVWGEWPIGQLVLLSGALTIGSWYRRDLKPAILVPLSFGLILASTCVWIFGLH